MRRCTSIEFVRIGSKQSHLAAFITALGLNGWNIAHTPREPRLIWLRPLTEVRHWTWTEHVIATAVTWWITIYLWACYLVYAFWAWSLSQLPEVHTLGPSGFGLLGEFCTLICLFALLGIHFRPPFSISHFPPPASQIIYGPWSANCALKRGANNYSHFAYAACWSCCRTSIAINLNA